MVTTRKELRQQQWTQVQESTAQQQRDALLARLLNLQKQFEQTKIQLQNLSAQQEYWQQCLLSADEVFNRLEHTLTLANHAFETGNADAAMEQVAEALDVVKRMRP